MCYQEKKSTSKNVPKSNKELLTEFKKYNKVAREARAKKLGFKDAANYIAHLCQVIQYQLKEEPVAPKKEKKATIAKEAPVKVIHIVDVLDSSGSMAGSKHKAAMKGINSGIDELKSNTLPVKYYYTLCDFSQDVLFPFVEENPERVPIVRTETRGTTALFDAIGESITKVDRFLREDDKVLVNVYTDGMENASRKYNATSISALIKEYAKKGFTVTFIGTAEDVKFVNKQINIDASNSLVYDGTGKGLEATLDATRSARTMYASNVVAGNDVSKGFYKNIKK